MNINKARNLLSIDINGCMNFEELQKHYVSLLDAWRHAKGEYGFNNSFFTYVPEMRGFTPTDFWMEINLANRLDEIEKILNAETV